MPHLCCCLPSIQANSTGPFISAGKEIRNAVEISRVDEEPQYGQADDRSNVSAEEEDTPQKPRAKRRNVQSCQCAGAHKIPRNSRNPTSVVASKWVDLQDSAHVGRDGTSFVITTSSSAGPAMLAGRYGMGAADSVETVQPRAIRMKTEPTSKYRGVSKHRQG